MGPAHVEAVFIRKGAGGELRAGDDGNTSIPLRTSGSASLERAAQTMTTRLAARRQFPRRIIIKDEEGTVLLIHVCPPMPVAGAAPSPEVAAADVAPATSAAPSGNSPKKEPTVADRVESSGSNVTPDTKLKHHRNIREKFRALQTAQGEYRAARKAAKSDGVNLRSYDMFNDLSKLDEDERRSLIRGTHEFGVLLGRPLGFQSDMFGEVEKPTAKSQDQHNTFVAYDAGYESGKRGDNGDPDQRPYPPGPLSEEWYRGWCEGQKLNAPGAQKNGTRKRGGKRGAGTENKPGTTTH